MTCSVSFESGRCLIIAGLFEQLTVSAVFHYKYAFSHSCPSLLPAFAFASFDVDAVIGVVSAALCTASVFVSSSLDARLL